MKKFVSTLAIFSMLFCCFANFSYAQDVSLEQTSTASPETNLPPSDGTPYPGEVQNPSLLESGTPHSKWRFTYTSDELECIFK